MAGFRSLRGRVTFRSQTSFSLSSRPLSSHVRFSGAGRGSHCPRPSLATSRRAAGPRQRRRGGLRERAGSCCPRAPLPLPDSPLKSGQWHSRLTGAPRPRPPGGPAPPAVRKNMEQNQPPGEPSELLMSRRGYAGSDRISSTQATSASGCHATKPKVTRVSQPKWDGPEQPGRVRAGPRRWGWRGRCQRDPSRLVSSGGPWALVPRVRMAPPCVCLYLPLARSPVAGIRAHPKDAFLTRLSAKALFPKKFTLGTPAAVFLHN